MNRQEYCGTLENHYTMGKTNKKKDTAGVPGTQQDCTASSPTNMVQTTPLDVPVGEPSLGDILQAITSSREILESKIDTLATDLGLLREDQRCLAESVAIVEQNMDDLKLEVTVVGHWVTTLEKQV
ncbi:hypothetical protein NDU88_005078 [Pleurodeles waltl]|uniref:Uncharacterized protein n=1 Tax=Pleurodeles waltl TaxID=8319 RepID=A0AAV7RJX8_PLEWA|nr:hypothetical protein NDU88_005078 [Pleurodeles waltl]